MSPKQKEAALTDSIRNAVRREYPNCWDIKVLGGNFSAGGRRMSQRPGVPDLLFCIEGKFVGLEVKRPKAEGGGAPTAKQRFEMNKINLAGGHATVVRSAGEAIRFLRKVI